MTIYPVNVASLKKVKNSVIGNPSAKKQLSQDTFLIQTLVACLNTPHIDTTYHDPSGSGPRVVDESLRIEAAHVIASLASSEDALSTLLDHEAIRAFLIAISYLQPTDSIALRSAMVRGLRALAIAMAEIAGPTQWGLKVDRSGIRNRARDGLNYLFQTESIDIYMPLLDDPSPHINALIAQLIALAVRTQDHRKILSEWLPHEDRIREAKTSRRGWEKTSVVNLNAPSRQGGWLARHLAGLLGTRDSKLQEAVLQALAALAKDNPIVAMALIRPDRDQQPVLSTVVTLIRSRNVDIQLAAALCATHIMRGTIPNSAYPIDESYVRTVINFVNNIIITPSPQTAARRTKACFILYYLATDDASLCGTVYDRGCLERLVYLVREITPEDYKSEWGEDEAESTSLLRESALNAIAAISLFDDLVRRAVTDDLQFVPIIHTCLFHQHVGVRYAACQCVRALGRAVSVLRTNIVDSGLGMIVFEIFKKKEEDINVTNAALSAVCNILTDFSPLRPIYLEQGLMERIIELLDTNDPTLKLNALWAVKNLLRKSTTETKRSVMQQFGWARIIELLQNTSATGLQEQAFNILRNTAESVDGIDIIFKNISLDVLLLHITNALGSSIEDVVLQATCLLANLINGSEEQQTRIALHPQLLTKLRTCLAEGKADIKRPATSCIYQLARRNPRARRAMIETGIVSTLRHLSEWSGSGLSSSVSSPINIGVSGSGTGGVGLSAGPSNRALSPGGRNWGSSGSGSHGHLNAGFWPQTAHHPGAGAFHPHGSVHHGTTATDDVDIVHHARAALDWLERGDAYTS